MAHSNEGMHGTVSWATPPVLPVQPSASDDPLDVQLRAVAGAVARGDAEGGLPIALAAVSAARAAGRDAVLAALLLHLGVLRRLLGHYTLSAEVLLEALQIFSRLEMVAERAEAFLQLGQSPLELGDYDTALHVFRNGLTEAAASGNELVRARAFRSVGLLMGRLGNWSEAERLHEKALEYFESTDNQPMVAATLNSVALATLRNVSPQDCTADSQARERVIHAIAKLERASALAVLIGNQRLHAQTEGNLGNAHGLLGDVERNIRHESAALAVFERLGARRDQCLSYLNIGRAHAAAGQRELAEAALAAGLALADKYGLKLDAHAIEAALVSIRGGYVPGPAKDGGVSAKLKAESVELAQDALAAELRATIVAPQPVDPDGAIDAETGLFSRQYLERWYRDFAAAAPGGDRRIGIALMGAEGVTPATEQIWQALLPRLERDLRVDVFGVALSSHVVLLALPDFSNDELANAEGQILAQLGVELLELAQHKISLWFGMARGDSTDSLAALIRQARDSAERCQ